MILGNPPYNVKSKNKGAEILELLQSYKQGLKETNIQPLDDDYIKFIRFAQWKLIEQKQQSGIMGFITNNSFLFGRTHRKMRQSLAKTFDEIYILNLHGDSTEDKNDKNVFDIRVGVCISLFVKYENSHTDAFSCHTDTTYHTKTPCHTERSEVSQIRSEVSQIQNRDFSLSTKAQNDKSAVIANEQSKCGNPKNNGNLATIHYFSTKDNEILRRADKFALLNDIAQNGLDSIKWQNLKLDSPYFWFVPKDFSNAEYENFWALAGDKSFQTKAIFKNYGSGNKAERDKICIHFDKESVVKVVNNFADKELDIETIRQKYELQKDSRDWSIERARADVIANVDCHDFANAKSRNDKAPVIANEVKQSIKNKITQIAYRPFDTRYTFFTGKSKGFWGTPSSLSKHFLSGKNLGLCFTKDCESDAYDNAIISDKPVDIHYNGGQTYIAPLYTYPDEFLQGDKTPNFTQEFSAFIAKHKVLKNKTPEQILAFIYANLYNPAYRAKYIEYLKIGFPRIDFDIGESQFEKYANLGQNLIDLHLTKTIPQDKEIDLKFREGADKSNPNFTLNKPKYEPNLNKIILNADLEIIGISQEVWDYTIGGYKVLDKWLKYRANDKNGAITLSQADFTHILNVAKILKATIAIQRELGKI